MAPVLGVPGFSFLIGEVIWDFGLSGLVTDELKTFKFKGVVSTHLPYSSTGSTPRFNMICLRGRAELPSVQDNTGGSFRKRIGFIFPFALSADSVSLRKLSALGIEAKGVLFLSLSALGAEVEGFHSLSAKGTDRAFDRGGVSLRKLSAFRMGAFRPGRIFLLSPLPSLSVSADSGRKRRKGGSVGAVPQHADRGGRESTSDHLCTIGEGFRSSGVPMPDRHSLGSSPTNSSA